MERSDIPLSPRVLRRSRVVPSAPKSKAGKTLLGHHVRQRPVWFDERGEDMQGRIRAVMLRRQLRGETEWRDALRAKLGREPTRKECRVALAKRYRAAKKAAKAHA